MLRIDDGGSITARLDDDEQMAPNPLDFPRFGLRVRAFHERIKVVEICYSHVTLRAVPFPPHLLFNSMNRSLLRSTRDSVTSVLHIVSKSRAQRISHYMDLSERLQRRLVYPERSMMIMSQGNIDCTKHSSFDT